MSGQRIDPDGVRGEAANRRLLDANTRPLVGLTLLAILVGYGEPPARITTKGSGGTDAASATERPGVRERVSRYLLHRREAVGYAAAFAFALLLTLGVLIDWVLTEIVPWQNDGLSGWPNGRSADVDEEMGQSYSDGRGALAVWLGLALAVFGRIEWWPQRKAAPASPDDASEPKHDESSGSAQADGTEASPEKATGKGRERSRPPGEVTTSPEEHGSSTGTPSAPSDVGADEADHPPDGQDAPRPATDPPADGFS